MGISVQTLIGLSMISHWPPGSDLGRICLDGSLTYDKPVKKNRSAFDTHLLQIYRSVLCESFHSRASSQTQRI